LPQAISLSDKTILYDNSAKDPLRQVANPECEHFQFKDAPDWATDVALQSAQIVLCETNIVSGQERSTKCEFYAAVRAVSGMSS